MAPAHKGGAYGHNTRRTYRPRGYGAFPPTRATPPDAKGAAREQGDRWMRAEGES
ncbi:hypothetical protein B296_00018492 [Ensete ventricosum]|uniref:Uncharacterized protein n=1 Tax=Ensete ventricosum TaxID=4639 RepID=A0A426YWG6_ENSVE|nr:hypothetical protein B296_00018492 [Ensete ventricosum]